MSERLGWFDATRFVARTWREVNIRSRATPATYLITVRSCGRPVLGSHLDAETSVSIGLPQLLDASRRVVRLSGGFLNPEAMPQLGWQVVSARDFDRDGGADVLWQHSVSRKLVLWRMDGLWRRGGVFTQPADAPSCVPPASAGCWQVVGPR